MDAWQKIQKKLGETLGLKRLFDLVWQCGPQWMVTNVTLILILGVTEIGLLYFIKKMVDVISGGLKATSTEAVFSQVAFYLGLAAAAGLIGVICRALTTFVSEAQAQRLTDLIQEKLHAKSIEIDLEYYENSKYYDSLHLAQKEAPVRPTRIVKGLVQIGQFGVSLAAIAVVLFILHWTVAVVLFVAFLPGLILRLKFSEDIHRWQKGSSRADREAQYFSSMLTGEAHAKEIRLFGLGPMFCDRFRDVRKTLFHERVSLARKKSIGEVITQTFAILLIFGAYGFIAMRTVQGGMTVGDLVLYFQGFQRGQIFLQMVLLSLADLYEDNLFLTHLYQFLDLKRTVVEVVHPEPVPRPMARGITIENLSFSYPNDQREALHEISLQIKPGEKVALVGDNGSGKTTLIKLLCRLYDPTHGRICLDGIDLRQMELTALRREISVVFQDYVHYNLSARDNIWFGNIHLPPNQKDLEVAATRAGADQVIARLKRGYDTMLGRLFEDGHQLSIGQWQKIALARAFLRPSQIIVLDEPSSAMDPKAEYELFKKFYDLVEGRTGILISHRLSTVKMADRIYVMQGGRLIENGTHHELVERQGAYATLFETQAQYYR